MHIFTKKSHYLICCINENVQIKAKKYCETINKCLKAFPR